MRTAPLKGAAVLTLAAIVAIHFAGAGHRNDKVVMRLTQGSRSGLAVDHQLSAKEPKFLQGRPCLYFISSSPFILGLGTSSVVLRSLHHSFNDILMFI